MIISILQMKYLPKVTQLENGSLDSNSRQYGFRTTTAPQIQLENSGLQTALTPITVKDYIMDCIIQEPEFHVEWQTFIQL